MAEDRIQLVAILPGGHFLGLGLIDVDNVDILIAYLASRDERGGHAISPIDVRRAYDHAKARAAAAAAPGNNDADDDCA